MEGGPDELSLEQVRLKIQELLRLRESPEWVGSADEARYHALCDIEAWMISQAQSEPQA